MLRAIYSKPLERKFREGARNRNKSEDLPCKIRFTAFEEKALNLMTGHPSIISFITLIQRKYVQTNRLCQVYYVCPVEAISPGHFDGHILFT